MCEYIHSVDTKTKFVILMHPKEFRKVKNGTGHLTHLALKNSSLHVGIDFSDHKGINEIIDTHQSYILYPSKDAINLSNTPLQTEVKDIAIFIIDSTWSCAEKIFIKSKNLHNLKHVSFDATKLSEFKIKQQPKDYCLSTIESTLSVLELLHKHGTEKLEQKDFDNFLNPFKKMIDYQQSILEDSTYRDVRFKKYN